MTLPDLSQRYIDLIDSLRSERLVRRLACAATWCVAILVCGVCSGQQSDTQPDSVELARMLPHAINRIVVVRVADILNTQRAKEEDWAKNAREKFLSGAAVIPHWVDTLVLGSLIQPGSDERVWTAGVFTVPKTLTLKQLARQERTEIERIADRSAVRARQGAYLVRLKSGLFGVLSPAFRQLTARWIRALDGQKIPPMSPYLQQAAATDAHIVIALDMQDMFDPQRTREFIAAMPQFENNASVTRSMGNLMGDAVGTTFQCTIGAEANAVIRISFSRDVKISSKHLKFLFLEIVERMGAALDELSEAELTVDGSDVVISTTLSESSLRLVMSMVVTPALSHRAPETVSPPQPGNSTRIDEKNSRHYFLAVNDAIHDLNRINRKNASYERTLKWHETCAEKIYNLRTEGVDPELVEYGSKINHHFRALAASLRGLAVEVNAQQQSVTWNYDYDPGWGSVNIWGGVGGRMPSWRVDSNLKEVRQRQAAAIADGAKQREDIWLLIDGERQSITRTMQSRYDDAFVKPRPRTW